MNMKRMLTLAVVAAAAVAGGLAAGHWFRGGPAENVAEAATAPGDAVAQLWAAALTDADGKPATLASFKGQKVVVNFWASWCGPCVQEMPELVALSHEYRQKGIRFIGIGVDSGQNVKNFLQKVKVDYPVFVSGYAGADLARNFGNAAGALPFTVVIDEHGKIRETKLGQIQPAELKKTLDAL
ncbi:TlpA family protein disulfide reductase [Burkholderia ubonensis]|uniref:TlpA family protein disulfide reductase n=1 Tax=Burkholderia ubonensis TaxID=101571 RepID=UPI0007579165|nr:TlpA disulfide reductase family protein [Burkholderia ubonensis]KVP43072.1 redoxin [Burkholderia ubonensis]KVQ76242.1 redoxin [Burkholderia ubonensis]KVV56104.1 redoxin [Burkholderia ubonensis]KVW18404.1 redoxin [Burkholderia ubonensis]KWD29810.1 redoxin [Burkholderia ubonensis]